MDDADRDGFRAWAGEWVRDRPEIPRQPDGRPSLDFARRVLVDLEAPLLDAAHLVAILQWLPFVAAMRPEEFFHPASEASLLEGRYDVAQAQRLAACFRAGEPVRAVPTPGRNERCPCGSGRKYKKCCLGRPATAQGAPA